MYTTYVGLCERDTNVERYSVWVGKCFLGGVRDRQGICVDDISIKKCNICNVCEIEAWIYHIYRGAIHEKKVEVSIESKRGMMMCVRVRDR